MTAVASYTYLMHILMTLHQLLLDGLVEICWVPAHMAIHGDEKADVATEDTCSLSLTSTLLPGKGGSTTYKKLLIFQN